MCREPVRRLVEPTEGGGSPRDWPSSALDVGTSGVKALAISPLGEVLAQAEHEYPLSTPQPGWAEQDPEHWWRASEAALADLDVERRRSASRARCTASSCTTPHDRVLRPAILWNDQRTAAQCAEIERAPRLASASSN